jgi:hypothetical protein
MHRDGIFKLLRIQGIESKESIPPAYVAWRAGTTTLFLLGSELPLIVLKFQQIIKTKSRRYLFVFS